MVLDERARWTSTLAIGQIRVTVVAAGRPPHKWHSGVHAQVNCCVDAAHDGPPAAGRTILEPADGQERNYASMAAALAADDSVGLFTLDAHGGEYRLRSLGE
ncbi:MAG TPA: hypothetical protein PKE32_00965, partial [Miltoncostaeaceae bacterium]|nr:hypothetical protein [Miltoncostaeaceae bacterium]